MLAVAGGDVLTAPELLDVQARAVRHGSVEVLARVSLSRAPAPIGRSCCPTAPRQETFATRCGPARVNTPPPPWSGQRDAPPSRAWLQLMPRRPPGLSAMRGFRSETSISKSTRNSMAFSSAWLGWPNSSA